MSITTLPGLTFSWLCSWALSSGTGFPDLLPDSWSYPSPACRACGSFYFSPAIWQAVSGSPAAAASAPPKARGVRRIVDPEAALAIAGAGGGGGGERAGAGGGAGVPSAAAAATCTSAIDFTRYELFHVLTHRAIIDDDESWTLEGASALARTNWAADSSGLGGMARPAFERAIGSLARSWADGAACSPSLLLSLRCVAAGAGLPDNLPTIFLFCLAQTITTGFPRPPWPASAAAPPSPRDRDDRELESEAESGDRERSSSPLRLRVPLDVPLGACTQRAVLRILSEHQLPLPPIRPRGTRASGPGLRASTSASAPPSLERLPSPSPRPDAGASSSETGSGSGPAWEGPVGRGLQRAALENRLRGLLRRPRSLSAADPEPEPGHGRDRDRDGELEGDGVPAAARTRVRLLRDPCAPDVNAAHPSAATSTSTRVHIRRASLEGLQYL
eukprot:tig00020951_g16460.t1